MTSKSPSIAPLDGKRFAWNETKDLWLRTTRGIGFEDVVRAIRAGDLLDVAVRTGPSRHAGQRILVIRFAGYAWLVPFVEDGREFFLKTIIPSRKATRIYLSKDRYT